MNCMNIVYCPHRHPLLGSRLRFGFDADTILLINIPKAIFGKASDIVLNRQLFTRLHRMRGRAY